MCEHLPTCPSPEGPDRAAARIRAAFPGQGWSLLCNGVVVFDDAGAILPDRRIVGPNRPLSGEFLSGHPNASPLAHAA
jgi:hypothetical protein